MMLPITDLKVRSLDVDAKEVSWGLSLDTQEDALDYTLQIWRSESPQGPFEPVSPEFEDRYIFVDRRIPSGDKFRKLWYKLITTHKSSQEIKEYGPSCQEPDPDQIAMAIRRHEQTLFTQGIGRAVWLFKRRSFGPICTTCYDSVLCQRVADRCLDCFGTGKLRGFHNPIEVWMQIDPSTKSQQNNAPQISQAVGTSGRMTYYPNLNPGDMVVEAENLRWEIGKITTSERLRAVVKQEFELIQIDDQDIRFKVPININKALRDIQPNPGRMMDNPQDLNAALHRRLPAVFGILDAFLNPPEE